MKDNAVVSSLTWTQEKPPRPGYYWCKCKSGFERTPYIRYFEKLEYGKGLHPIQPQDGPKSSEGYDWFAGPIEKPEHAQAANVSLRDQGSAKQ